MKKLLTIFLLLLITAAVVIYFGLIHRPPLTPTISQVQQIDGVLLPEAIQIKNFHLTNNQGKAFTKDNLKNHWTMLFFGFTNCGMVCPTTMSELNKMYQILEKELPRDQLPQIVLISVDPERDSISRINDYVTAFNPHFIGARGNIETLEKELHIIAVKMQVEGEEKNNYTINHSAEIMLMNPDAKLQAFMSYPHKADQMVKDYKLITATHDKVLHDTHGNSVFLSTLKGKWVVLNVWAPWCSGCIKEIPELNRFYKNNQNKNIVFYGIDYDNLSLAELQKAIHQVNMQFPVFVENPASYLGLQDVNIIPATFIINPEGVVVKKIVGENTEKSLSAIVSELQQHDRK